MPGKKEGESFPCSLFLLLRAQKKKQEKGTPASPGPAGFPYFSPGAGRGKTRASPSNSSRVFSRPRLRGAAGQMGEGKIPLARSRAPERLPKRDLHCLRRSRVCKAPAASRSTGYPACGGTRDTGGPFFGSFLWASKEMNRRIKLFLWLPGLLGNQKITCRGLGSRADHPRSAPSTNLPPQGADPPPAPGEFCTFSHIPAESGRPR